MIYKDMIQFAVIDFIGGMNRHDNHLEGSLLSCIHVGRRATEIHESKMKSMGFSFQRI